MRNRYAPLSISLIWLNLLHTQALPASQTQPSQDALARVCSGDLPLPPSEVAAIVAQGAPAALEIAASLSHSTDAALRRCAARILREFPSPTQPINDSLRSVLVDPDEELRVVAASTLIRIDPASSQLCLPVLTAGLTSQAVAVRREAIGGLAAAGQLARDAIPALRTALADPDPDVASVASAAIAALSPAAHAETQQAPKDRLFLMGVGMLRLNWTSVEGNEIRFRYSDLGLPAEFSTRERASFILDGTLGHGAWDLSGHLDYDPENRITEPPLDFLVSIDDKRTFFSGGDFRNGVFQDSVFSYYYHPFRGIVAGRRSDRFSFEALGGLARGESGIDDIPADAGAGPYYIKDAPILRGSEIVYLITKSSVNPDVEIRRLEVARNSDYFIDYDRGALIFNYPLLPLDELGNPVFILITYQYESLAGRFTRYLAGGRATVSPIEPLTLRLTYIADADSEQDVSEAFDNHRGIGSLGIGLDTERVKLTGELARSREPSAPAQTGVFGGGRVSFTPRINLYFNTWSVDPGFTTFANRQLQYGYSLYQVFPAFADRSIFLSPFQFTRNLGSELYPFTLSRVSIDEDETNAFAEWDVGRNRISGGYGTTLDRTTDMRTNTSYLSTYQDGDATKFWGRARLETESDPGSQYRDTRALGLLAGLRQRLWKRGDGGLYLQADYDQDVEDDLLNIAPDTRAQTISLFGEYVTGQEGFFAGYRKELLTDTDAGETLLDSDIFEAGVKEHVYKGLFVDLRYRDEQAERQGDDAHNRIISVGGGVESQSFRAMGRYEVQLNRSGDREGRRQLWSLFVFGSPIREMNVSLRYYKQLGKDEAPTSLSERSEEELSFRLLWKITRRSSVYSQWRYDTNIELYPPLDRTRSNSVASVQGFTFRFTQKLDALANYKLIKIWGPIDNRKESATAEVGYLIYKHFRLGIGGEYIDYSDQRDATQNYATKVGYFKLVALF